MNVKFEITLVPSWSMLKDEFQSMNDAIYGTEEVKDDFFKLKCCFSSKENKNSFFMKMMLFIFN